MKITLLLAAVSTLFCTPVLAEIVSFGFGKNQFELEFVKIGDPGNRVDDTFVEDPLPPFGDLMLGQIEYTYWISKHEISREQFDIANADGNFPAWARLDEGELLPEAPTPDMPAMGMEDNEAEVFINWMNEVHEFPLPYNLGAGHFPRRPFSKFVLPTLDEWHKAAFYDPEKNNGEVVTGTGQLEVMRCQRQCRVVLIQIQQSIKDRQCLLRSQRLAD